MLDTRDDGAPVVVREHMLDEVEEWMHTRSSATTHEMPECLHTLCDPMAIMVLYQHVVE